METDRHRLFDLTTDPGQTIDRAGSPAEAEAVELLRHALAAVDAPIDQLRRLGLG